MGAWLKQYEADTCSSTDGDGHLQGKEDDIRDAESGSFTFRPEKVSQSRVRVYGDAAVYTGLIQGRGNENGKEFVGYSRITDTWVKLNGKWQLLRRIPERIADAETALVNRAGELPSRSEDKFEEKESLDDALCILHALRDSLKRRPTAVRETNRFNQLMLSAGS
jgi:hypothetical protein